MNVDDAFRKFDDISYFHEWAKLYNEYFIRRNNELNMVFARILKMTDKEEIIDLIHMSDLNVNDINYRSGMKYGNW